VREMRKARIPPWVVVGENQLVTLWDGKRHGRRVKTCVNEKSAVHVVIVLDGAAGSTVFVLDDYLVLVERPDAAAEAFADAAVVAACWLHVHT
jgi:ribosomal protein L39E